MWKQTHEGKILLALRKQQDRSEQNVEAWQQPALHIRENYITTDSLKDELRKLLSLRTELEKLDEAVANKTSIFSQSIFSQKKDLERKNNEFRERLEAHSNELYDVAQYTFYAGGRRTLNEAKRWIGDAAIKANIVDLQDPLINQSDFALRRVNSKLNQSRRPDLDKNFLIDELRGIRNRLGTFFLSEERFKGPNIQGFLRFQQAAFQNLEPEFNEKTKAFNDAIGDLTEKAGLNMAELLELSDMAGVHTTGRLNRIEQDLNQKLLNWNKAEPSANSSSKLDSRSFERALHRLNDAMNTLETLRRSNGSNDPVDRHLRVQQEELITLFERLEDKLITFAEKTKRIEVRRILAEITSTRPPGYGQSESSPGLVSAAQTLVQFNNQPQRREGRNLGI